MECVSDRQWWLTYQPLQTGTHRNRRVSEVDHFIANIRIFWVGRASIPLLLVDRRMKQNTGCVPPALHCKTACRPFPCTRCSVQTSTHRLATIFIIQSILFNVMGGEGVIPQYLAALVISFQDGRCYICDLLWGLPAHNNGFYPRKRIRFLVYLTTRTRVPTTKDQQ